MSIISKATKYYIKFMQIQFGIGGGVIYLILIILSKIIKPLRRILEVFKNGAPPYSTLILATFFTALLLLSILGHLVLTAKVNPQEFLIGYVIMFLLISPWSYLQLDLFAYYKRFRSDRKK